jgi:toxin ParE1/3/4
MSAHDLNLVVTQRARADLLEIHYYTLQQWGFEQAKAYEERLWAAIDHLVRNPDMGRRSRRVKGGFREFSLEHHTVYYRVESDTIYVLRIVHYRQEFRSSMLFSEE